VVMQQPPLFKCSCVAAIGWTKDGYGGNTHKLTVCKSFTAVLLIPRKFWGTFFGTNATKQKE